MSLKYVITSFGKKNRRFNSSWFADHLNWLEYSIDKDATFCLCCYLFKEVIGRQDFFTVDMRSTVEFSALKGIGNL